MEGAGYANLQEFVGAHQLSSPLLKVTLGNERGIGGGGEREQQGLSHLDCIFATMPGNGHPLLRGLKWFGRMPF